ncbi:erythromycin esterase family protein [Actinomadura sp. 7K507]|uniref:erythromycin esterase family protein n=1 Tax=Actinomadura sp. 7K507 TaxID=2530365 RepID=UPI00104F1850|nr:erythromycin esterase family protein [Actinomadura sp. 7K507]TDC84785.1 erythromycin esterase family protein [Actinomadura sp. 7K507]
MSQGSGDFVSPSCEVLALGEPTHPSREPAFGPIRNELFASLAGQGFRSIALETDRVAALAVNDFVQDGFGTLDAAMREGFSHGFGHLEANRRLVTWMREYNEGRPAGERLAFHGFDAQAENTSAPSPRRYLEYGCDYLGLDPDIASLLGPDERWSREEAILDPAKSIGDNPEAARLRVIADDLLTSLYTRAPELIAATSRAEWFRARTHLTAGLGLLRYHRQSAQRIEESTRISRLMATRDALMAQNLLDIRTIEGQRGATLVFAHNSHLQRNPSSMHMAGMDIGWHSAGAIVGTLLDERYTVIIGSMGRSEALELGEPEPDTYEGVLQRRFTTWGLTPAAAITSARTRTDVRPEQVYAPLDHLMVDSADAILHVTVATER